MSVDGNEMQNVLLPIIDRLLGPLVTRLDHMDARQREDTQQLNSKLDGVIQTTHRVQTAENNLTDVKKRLDDMEVRLETHALELGRTKGRNEVIMWVLGVIGGPVVGALVLAGIVKLFGIDVGGV